MRRIYHLIGALSNVDVRRVVLDVYKAFEKMWQIKFLLCKLEPYRIKKKTNCIHEQV